MEMKQAQQADIVIAIAMWSLATHREITQEGVTN